MTASSGSGHPPHDGHAPRDMGADLWPERQPTVPSQRLALVDLLDRVLAGGVVVAGDVTLSIAGVDMVIISLRALVTSASVVATSSGVLEPAE